MVTPKQSDPQFKLRMTPEIKLSIEKAAAADGRSMNTEILRRLSEYDRRLDDILWQKKEMGRLRDDLEAANKMLRDQARASVEDLLYRALPSGLFRRIEQAAAMHERAAIEEVVQALEAAFPPPPPFSYDWFFDEWMTKIGAATEAERPALLVEANAILKANGDKYEVWLDDDDAGESQSVVFGTKGARDLRKKAV